MKLTLLVASAASMLSLTVADNCYVQIQQQFDGGIGSSASPIEGEVKRGDCPMDVNTPNTDNCREIGAFTPNSGGPSVVTSELPYTVIVHVTGGTNGFNDGYGDYADQHFDFHSDYCKFSQSSGFAANLNLLVCKFQCP
ncbi:Hypothetical protein R9X50_00741300 [Acrodontium crateriforme]|uniref:Uncharacterized protein n=1 Tax=Acrodontium crateriforme TaxID=150365 RepID=A0AAQ3R7N1_9PEZI|nr:Hypothetical protein R9X50_00741300 [Acrodontium crateriforme]